MTEPRLDPYAEDAPVRFGTSSFSHKDWVGPFYPPGTAPGAYLGHYATVFDTVEVDATYYAIPDARLVDGWDAKTPEGFLLCAKFPRAIVHGGEAARPNPAQVLMPDATYADRDAFLEVMARLGPKLGPLVLQFPYFNRSVFPSAGPFLDRLDPFLRDLPRGRYAYGVEIRNKSWLTKELDDILTRREVSLVLSDQAWMPHGDRVAARFDACAGGFAYMRLLGDRKRIEAVTKTWEKEVLDHESSLRRWAALLVRMMKHGMRSLVYVNNHYAGHAPATVRRLREYVREAARATDS